VPQPYIMGLSAAAVALQNGDYNSLFSSLGISELLLMLGLNMGGFIALHQNSLITVLLVQQVVQIIFFVPLIVSFFLPQSLQPLLVAITVLTSLCSFALSPLLDFYSLRAIEYLPGGLQFRILTKYVAWTIRPPPILYLSDGGHTENLALLPLLAKRLPFIIIADGSSDPDPVSGLRLALKQARNKLPVTFHASKWDQNRRMGDSVKEDLAWELETDMDNWGKQLSQNKCRAFMFKASYNTFHQFKEPGADKSIIIYLKPNPFEPEVDDCNNHRTADHEREKDQRSDLNLECACHRWCCRLRTCSLLCGTFPEVSTANQFFTPMLWEKFHQQGFAAAFEAINIIRHHQHHLDS